MIGGLYVHVPFCLTRCGYCDFNAYSDLAHMKDPYSSALLREGQMRAKRWSDVEMTSVFFGGGTPTTLAPETLGSLLEGLRDTFSFGRDPEVTTEANPDTVDREGLGVLLEAGFNRISIGVQSFDPVVLEALERVHGPESARRAFAAARASGFTNIGLDLIYGAYGETLASWQRTLGEAIALSPEHISAYALTVEPATALGRKVAAGAVPAPDPDVQADMFDAACRGLSSAGYVHYEVSNWAKPGRECRHNLGYWRHDPYLGLGAGAHSFRDGHRWWNLRPPEAYVRAVATGSEPVGGGEMLDDETLRLEDLLLGLRTAAGVPRELADLELALPLQEAGLLMERDGRLALTERGMFLANEVVLALSRNGADRAAPTRGPSVAASTHRSGVLDI